VEFETDFYKVYRMILRFAPRWLRIMGYETFEQFLTELSTKRTSVLKLEHGYVFLDEYVPGVRMTAHPCFTHRPDFRSLEEFYTVLDRLFQDYGIHRLQIRVFETAGRTIRKILRELGFTLEVVLRNYARDLCSVDQRLISSELWSIVR
jgi:hypothetical protein